ncbi:ATP-binding protein [Streptomyces sp. NPDC002870]|uniref:ATP-binding protein n=1 Tax=Streptomyces sp. NPDC002870 TaxID=3364666 RepID=UPI0036917E50
MCGNEVANTRSRLRFVLPFVAEPAELHVLRTAVREQLAHWGFQALEDEVQLAVTELAANVIKHVGAGAAATLVMEPSEARLRVELHDKSSAVPTLRDPDCEGECGRGLHLLEALAAEWGTAVTAAGKGVWCEIALGSVPRLRQLRRAVAALEHYRGEAGPVGMRQVRNLVILEDAATDLIADLLHWVAAQGGDPDELLDRALMHYEAEAQAA